MDARHGNGAAQSQQYDHLWACGGKAVANDILIHCSSFLDVMALSTELIQFADSSKAQMAVWTTRIATNGTP